MQDSNPNPIPEQVPVEEQAPPYRPVQPVPTNKEITFAKETVVPGARESGDTRPLTSDNEFTNFLRSLDEPNLVTATNEELATGGVAPTQVEKAPVPSQLTPEQIAAKEAEQRRIEEEILNNPLKLSDILNPKPADAPVPASQTQAQNEVDIRENTDTFTPQKEQAYLAEIESLKAKLTAVEMLEKNPYEYLKKHMPALIVNQFDEASYVQSKLRERGFGDDFVVNQQEVHIIGTPSWNYNQLQSLYFKEALDIKNGANATIGENQAKVDGIFEAKKSEIMTKYKLSPEEFQNQIWSQLEGKGEADLLEVLSDAIIAKRELMKIKARIAEAVSRQNEPVSPVTAPGGTPAQRVAIPGQEGDPLASILPTRYAAKHNQ